MKLTLPAAVQGIIRNLTTHGYEAYIVGGCVRDSILMQEPEDWDITTSATPPEVKKLFHKTVDTGIQHGTVTVIVAGVGYEVTTYRVDGEYEDHRHPKEVAFTPSLEEDLKRRDFTINAMAYSDEKGLIDLYGGMADLQRKVVRCVGDPLQRFTEDALRMLRAVRFCAQLSFALDGETAEAVRDLAPTLVQISAERIRTELVKLIVSDSPQMIHLAYDLGITAVVLPEFDIGMVTEQRTPHHMYNVGEHTIKSMTFVRADKVLRLTMLLHDLGKAKVRTTDAIGRDHFYGHGEISYAMAREIMHRLRFDNDTIRRVTGLIRWHDYHPELTEKSVRRAINRISEELFPLYLEVQRADILAQSAYRLEEKVDRLRRVRQIYEKITREKQCITLKDLAVNGNDLIAAGVEPGREVGRLLQKALDEVLDHPQMNQKDQLLDFLSLA